MIDSIDSNSMMQPPPPPPMRGGPLGGALQEDVLEKLAEKTGMSVELAKQHTWSSGMKNQIPGSAWSADRNFI